MPEVTENFVRIPAQPKSAFVDGSIRSIGLSVTDGIRALIGKVKGRTTTAVMTYLFEVAKGWTLEKGKAWVARHQDRHLTDGWSKQVERWQGDADLRVKFVGETIRLEEPTAEEQVFGDVPVALLKEDEADAHPMDHVEPDENGVPKAFRIVKFGDLRNSKYNTLKVTELTGQGTMAWFKYKGMPRFPMDWSHKSADGTDESSPGWWIPEVRDDGIWATDLDWTKVGYKKLQEKEYRHFSLEAARNGDTDELLAIKCIALTNRPAENDQLPLVMSDAKNGGTSSPITPSEKEDDPMKKFYERLGLAETATEEEVLAALEALEGKTPEAAETKHSEALAAKDTEIDGLKAQVDPALTEFRAKTIALCELKEGDGFEKVNAYFLTMKAQEPDKAKLAELEVKVAAQEQILEATRIEKLVALVENKCTPDNRASVVTMATTLEPDEFIKTMKGWPEIKKDPTAPIGDAKLKDRNTDILLTPCLDDGDRTFFTSKGWDPKTEDGKKAIEAHIATKLGQ